MNDAFYTFYQAAMITSLVVAVVMAVPIFHFRARPGARMMLALAGGTFLWTLGFYLESRSGTLSRQLLFTDIGYVGMMAVPVAWFAFAAQYTNDRRFANWRLLRWLLILPAATIVLVWTNGAHHIMWSNAHLATSGPFTITVKTYEPFFWVAMSNNYLLILGGIIILTRRLFTGPPLYRNQAIALVIASLLPIAGNALYLSNPGGMPHKDLTPVAFALSGLAIALGFWRFQLFRAVPFAREMVIRRLKDGIFIFSPDGHLLDANAAGLEIVGYGQRIIGASDAELKLISPLFETLSSGGPRRTEISLDLAAGPRTFEVDTVALRDDRNRLEGWLSILHDITERKEGERTLAEALDHERELRRSLQEEINRRLRFSQALAHEVRAIVGRPASGERPEPDRTTIPDRGVEDLNLHLDDLLDFTRGEMGLIETVFRVISPLPAIRDTAAEPGIAGTLTMELPDRLPPVQADEARFRQIIRCLLNNARARCGPADTIRLQAVQENDNLVIEVRDSGPELDEAERDTLFNPYERAGREQPGGLGLGLALGKLLVELHGGRIWAESRPGEGCTFAFSLPVAEEG